MSSVLMSPLSISREAWKFAASQEIEEDHDQEYLVQLDGFGFFWRLFDPPTRKRAGRGASKVPARGEDKRGWGEGDMKRRQDGERNREQPRRIGERVEGEGAKKGDGPTWKRGKGSRGQGRIRRTSVQAERALVRALFKFVHSSSIACLLLLVSNNHVGVWGQDSPSPNLSYLAYTFLLPRGLFPPIFSGVRSSTRTIKLLNSAPSGPAIAAATASRPAPNSPLKLTQSWTLCSLLNARMFSNIFIAAWCAASYEDRLLFLNTPPVPPVIRPKTSPYASMNDS